MKHSEKFYFADLFICVENTLFKILRRDFEEGSEVFRDMYTLPAGRDTAADGSSAEHPLVLEGFKASDMEAFLSVMYPHPVHGIGEMPLERWQAVLRLAKMWQFEHLRTLAQEMLKALIKDASGIDCILLYDRCELERDEQFVAAVQGVVHAQRELPAADAARLGMDNVARIYRLIGWREARGLVDGDKVREVWGMPRVEPGLRLPSIPRLNRRPVRGDEPTIWHAALHAQALQNL